MEHYEKPPRKWWMTLFLGAMVLVMLVFGCVSVLRAFIYSFQYAEGKDHAVTIDAAVSRVDREYDKEDEEYRYSVYVAYEYDGVVYEVYHATEDSAVWMDRIGFNVKLEIDPKHPDAPLSNQWTRNSVMLVAGVLALCVSLIFGSFSDREGWVKTYGAKPDIVRKELEECVWRRFPWRCYLTAGVILTAYKILFWKISGPLILVLGVGLLIAGVLGFHSFWTDLKLAKNGNYVIRSITVVRKDQSGTTGESLNDVTNYLVLSDGEKTWKKVVSDAEYRSTEVGDIRSGVYIEGAAKAEFLFPADVVLPH